MYKTNKLFDFESPWAKFILTVFVMAISFLVFFFIGQILIGAIYGSEFAEPGFSYSSEPENIWRLRILQALQSTGLFVVPALVVAFLLSNSVKNYLFLNKKLSVSVLLLIFVLVISIQPIVNWTASLNQAISFPDSLQGIESSLQTAEEHAEKLTKLFLLGDTSTLALFINLLIVAVIPAVGEELLFRGVLQNIFKEWTANAHIAVWAAAFIFSAIHFQFYGFLPRLLLGAVFGYLLVLSGSMWLPIAAHFFNNAMGVIYYHFYFEKYKEVNIEEIGVSEDMYLWLGISVLISSLIIYYLYVLYKNKQHEQ